MNTPGQLLIASILPLAARAPAVRRPVPATPVAKRITKVEDATTLVKARIAQRLAALDGRTAAIARRLDALEKRLA